MKLARVEEAQIFNLLRQKLGSLPAQPYAMYSSLFEGIVFDSAHMVLPFEDHLVHRGDGVFEAIKCVDRSIYALDRHLARLLRSAEMIGLELPRPIVEIREITLEVLREAIAVNENAKDCVIRIFCSRGPGGFGVNPYESKSSQLYVFAIPSRQIPEGKYVTGAEAKISSFPSKAGAFGQIKSCNYLQNVLMKKESVDAGVAFTISLNAIGHLGEGATENFMIVSKDGDLIVPYFDQTLAGITVTRIMELVQGRATELGIRSVAHGNIRPEDVFAAREAAVSSTTVDCMPVTTFEGKKIGSGVAGPVCRQIRLLLQHDELAGPLSVKA